MSYESISIPDALNRINKHIGGWFLPQVQRQFVWGMRYESEEYICLLLDSIFRGYPIGGMVLWETEAVVPHHNFIGDYTIGEIAPQVEEGLWSRSKSLIYDGQQRLQTLHSVLRHTFNNKVLCFDTRFNADTCEADETGFRFVERASTIPKTWLRMNELTTKPDISTEKERLKDRFAVECETEDLKLLVKSNIDTLWTTFVGTTKRPIAYFSVRSNSDREVNEIFRRVNTGGIPLTQIELVLSKIKGRHPTFEESLYALSNEIEGVTGGFEFAVGEILQLLNLLIFETPRVDADRVKEAHIELFKTALDEVSPVLIDFFGNYVWGHFKINSASIVPRPMALLPLLAYLVGLRAHGRASVVAMPAPRLKEMHKFFILSQINGWNTQTMVTAIAKLAREAGKKGLQFPLQEAKTCVRNRSTELQENEFVWQPWFALKVLVPNRSYIFAGPKPQVDHIFPLHLRDMDETYRARVDVLWNFQPMPAGVNNFKRARHPFHYFQSDEGSPHLDEYDFIPPIADEGQWTNPARFIWRRKLRMMRAFWARYGLLFGKTDRPA